MNLLQKTAQYRNSEGGDGSICRKGLVVLAFASGAYVNTTWKCDIVSSRPYMKLNSIARVKTQRKRLSRCLVSTSHSCVCVCVRLCACMWEGGCGGGCTGNIRLDEPSLKDIRGTALQ